VTPKRWLILALVAGALLFALQGGEYSTPQWYSLRSKERVERARVAELEREVDSLTRFKKLVESDPVTQERIAREQYGMLRKGEVEFTVIHPEGKDK
jgi:cell division protein FtsB